MVYSGSCTCNRWRIEVHLAYSLKQLTPRVCDCKYCQATPSKMISDPTMSAVFFGNGLSITQHGDRLANFYQCKSCTVLLAVGCKINHQLRGAVNSNLLQHADQLGKSIQIQPKLLAADEKLKRWHKLWGVLSGF